jgi:starvation-inducible DNA-binding protein
MKNSNEKNKESKDLDLRGFLSETFVAYMKTYALHWNYEGAKFYGVHKMTEEQYTDMANAIDEMAERMRALGNSAPLSLQHILEHSSLKEYTNVADNDRSLQELIKSHRRLSENGKLLAKIADENEDPYTHDMIVARVGQHDKFAWMLESLDPK